MFYVDDNDDNRGWYREDRKGKGKKGGFKGKGKGKGLPQPSAPFERKAETSLLILSRASSIVVTISVSKFRDICGPKWRT